MKWTTSLSIDLLFTACFSWNINSGEISLLRSPFLQSDIADSISILWGKDHGQTCKVG